MKEIKKYIQTIEKQAYEDTDEERHTTYINI